MCAMFKVGPGEKHFGKVWMPDVFLDFTFGIKHWMSNERMFPHKSHPIV